MATSVVITPSPELVEQSPKMRTALALLEQELDRLPPTLLLEIVQRTVAVLSSSESEDFDRAAELFGYKPMSPSDLVATEITLLVRSFKTRRRLLSDSLSSAQVAKLLGTTRQTPHDRVAAGTLLAVKDNGTWRFPPWQFDPDGEDGVIAGLPEVLHALEVPALSKISWFVLPSPYLDGGTPLELLKSGDIRQTVSLARGVGGG